MADDKTISTTPSTTLRLENLKQLDSTPAGTTVELTQAYLDAQKRTRLTDRAMGLVAGLAVGVAGAAVTYRVGFTRGAASLEGEGAPTVTQLKSAGGARS